jgi:hypothetical protein
MTALQARQIESVKDHARQLGLRLNFASDSIDVEVSDHRRYKGFVKNARLARLSTIEATRGWLSGFAQGWTYQDLKR